MIVGLFSLPVVERCLCVTVHTLVKQNNNKRIFKNHRVSVLQAQTLLLLSTGTVVLSASVHSVVLKLWIRLRLSVTPQRCPNTAWSNSAPYCKTTGSFFIFLLPAASFIRYKELTHNPFIQTENRAARQLKEWCYIKSITVSTPFIRLLSHSSLGCGFCPETGFAVSSLNQTASVLVSGPVSMGLFCAGTLSEKEGPIWHPSVTPELLPVCRGQSTRPAAVFIYRRGRPVLRSVEKSEPASSLDLPAADHRFQLDLQHSLLFFFSASPKDRLTTSHFFCTHTPSASGLCRPLTGFSISTKWLNTRSGGEKTEEWSHEFMENGTLSTI